MAGEARGGKEGRNVRRRRIKKPSGGKAVGPEWGVVWDGGKFAVALSQRQAKTEPGIACLDRKRGEQPEKKSRKKI